MERQYKDSGIEWIGKIPETWEVTKLNTLYTQRIEKVSDKDYPPLSVTMQGILPQLENAAKTNNGDDRKLVCVGDFAINSRSDRRGSCGISPYEGSVSLINTILKPRNEMNPRYYNWLFHSSLFSDEFYKWGHGIVDDLWTTRWQEMRNITVPSPTLAVQQRIADYLDEKCGEIDSHIGLQEQMIEKLKAYKQSVITEAVTKGLNPRSAPTGTLRSAKNTKLVPSGIDWIGEIPSHWDIIKIGFIFINMDYLREPISAELRERNNPQYDYYGASGIIDKINHYNVEDKVLLIGEDSANLVMRNLPLIYKAEGKFWVNNHAHILKPRKDNYDFMAHALEACNYRDYITTGSAQPKLSQENLSRVQLPVPPLSEQQAIASYLDDKCSEIDNLIAVKQQKIEKLKDYKKSVIYEAITGKTDLRE